MVDMVVSAMVDSLVRTVMGTLVGEAVPGRTSVLPVGVTVVLSWTSAV
jgi:hypothetical protein